MKKIFISILFFLIGSVLIVSPAHAQMGMIGNYFNNNNLSSSQTEQQYQQNLNNLTNDIFKSQKVNSISKLDCKKINNDQFEKVGDAWMDVRIGNEATHQSMDDMMGGEGSQSLTNAHIQMGESYLGCTSTNANYGWMSMMSGFNNTAKGGASNMMGFGNYGITGGGNGLFILPLLIQIVVLIDLILVGVWLWKKIVSKK